jgi:hypothetical protein
MPWHQIPAEDRDRVLRWLEHLRPEPGLYTGPGAELVAAADDCTNRALDAARAEGLCAAEASA